MKNRALRRTLLALALLLAALVARGGTIAGRLLDVNGKPVAGSRVLWTAYREDDEVLFEQTQGTTPAVLGETKTDEAGRFRIAFEKPGVLLALRVVTPGFPEARLAGPSDSGDTTDLADLRLPAPAKLSGRVVDEAGKPVSGAQVTVLAGGAGFGDGDAVFLSEAKSGPDGAFAMPDAPDGTRVISARAAGFVPLSRFALEARADERIVMRAGGVVRGAVTDAAGKAVAGAIVVCEEVAARTDASGGYRLTGVPFGSRTVETVWKEDFVARKEAVKVLREAEADVPLRLAKAAAIAGTVVEESTRKAVAGVRVTLLNPGRLFGRRQAQRMARTDARGRFRAGGLGAHHYTVEAFRDGYLPATIPNVAAALAQPGSVAIALQRAATVAGVVTDDKGQAVGGARVRIQRDPNLRRLMRGASLASVFGQQSVLTGPDGAFLLRGLSADRGATLEATKTGFAAARKLGMSWKTGEQVKGVALALKKGLTARGKVVDAQNQAIAGAQIYAQGRDAATGGRRGGNVVMRAGNLAQGDRPDGVSGQDGAFVVGGLDEGEYAVSVSRDGYARKIVASLEVKGPDETKWPPIVLSAGMAVAGAVRNPQGQPVIGAQIFAIGENAGRPLDASSDGDGRFRIGGLAADRPIMLNVSADGYASVQRNVTPPVEDLAIVLKSTGTVRGRVLDAATQNPVTDFTIGRTAGGGFGGGFQIQIRNGAISNGDRSFQSSDGTFELTDVPPGKWTIRASASGYRTADVSGVEVGEGETKEGVVLSLKKGGSLTGRVLDPQKGTGVPNASVQWRAQGGGGGPFGGAMIMMGGGGNNGTATDANGQFSFDGLPEGKVTITASHPDYLDAARDVSPDQQQSVDITLGTGGSISGSVVGRDGRVPIAGAQVSLNEEGDSNTFANETTKTDGNGGFFFEHLRAGRYRLTAQTASGNSQPNEVVLADNQSQGGVLLQMISGALLHGTVSGLPAGRLGGVRIMASGNSYNDSAVTDDNGGFALSNVPSGVVRLFASTSFLQGRSTSQTVEVPDGAADVPVDIVFQGVSSLSGRVTRGGQALGGLFVNAVPDPPVGQGQRFSSQTDENGSYSLQGMTDGNYQVNVAGQGVNYRKAFAVSGDTSGDIQLPGVTITGTVIDNATSQPIESASVQAETGAETQAVSMKRAVTDSNGNFSIDDVDPGNYQVTARKTGYQLKTQSVSVASDPAQLSFALQPGTGVQIRVLDGLTGIPLKAVNALAFGANGTVASQGGVSLDATGTGEIPSLTQGRYSIYIFSDGYAPRAYPAVDVPAQLLTVLMTPGGRVDVRAAAPFSGQLLDGSGSLYLLGAFSLTGRVSVSPPITSWQHIAPGSYQLLVAGSGGQTPFPFTVAEGQITTILVK
jgi:protocatechuate 3,4-dioxygenase beta subunit